MTKLDTNRVLRASIASVLAYAVLWWFGTIPFGWLVLPIENTCGNLKIGCFLFGELWTKHNITVSLALLGCWLVLVLPAYIYSQLLPTAEMRKSGASSAQKPDPPVSAEHGTGALDRDKESLTQELSGSPTPTYSEAYRTLWWQLNGKIPAEQFVKLEAFVDILQTLELDRNRLIVLAEAIAEKPAKIDELTPRILSEIRSMEVYEGERRRHLADSQG